MYQVPFGERQSDAIPLFEAGESSAKPVLYSHFPSAAPKCTR